MILANFLSPLPAGGLPGRFAQKYQASGILHGVFGGLGSTDRDKAVDELYIGLGMYYQVGASSCPAGPSLLRKCSISLHLCPVTRTLLHPPPLQPPLTQPLSLPLPADLQARSMMPILQELRGFPSSGMEKSAINQHLYNPRYQNQPPGGRRSRRAVSAQVCCGVGLVPCAPAMGCGACNVALRSLCMYADTLWGMHA